MKSPPFRFTASMGVVAILAAGCATPPAVKDASAEQLRLLDEMQRSLEAIDSALARFHPSSSGLADRLAVTGPKTPQEIVDGLKDSALTRALVDARRSGREPSGSLGMTATVRSQLQVMSVASRVIHRFLAVDVFGNKEVVSVTDSVSKATEALK